MYRCILILLIALAPLTLRSAVAEDSVTVLEGVSVTASNHSIKRLTGATNTAVITTGELKRAACCNLGESFTTNPSVDVSYSDAATGARQIRLLGLSGTYVQLLGESVPMGTGAAAPYALGYVPGPWMQSIQVSKGASSVKNGFESITGQINVEFKKPQNDPSLSVNAYYDSMNKLELNFDGNLHLDENWSTGLLVHGERAFTAHDSDDDGFVDLPQTSQISLLNRWARMGTNYVFQGVVKYLAEWRRGGQHVHDHMPADPYRINIDTHRLEFFTKNAYIYDHQNDANVALIVSGSWHDQNALYGRRIDNVSQLEGYASLMYERKWADAHAISAGIGARALCYTFDYAFVPGALLRSTPTDASAGAYAQYTYTAPGNRLIAMAGMRVDRHNRYGWLPTPRMHVRWTPVDALSVNVSAGRGYHVPQPLAEYSYLLASSRTIDIAPVLHLERAWNMGGGFTATVHPAGRRVSLSADYYFTRFTGQLTIDLDTDPHAAMIYSATRPTGSQALQLEAEWDVVRELTLTAAWRYTAVKTDIGGRLVYKSLTPRHKGLFTAAFKPMMGLWQFDATLAVTGGGTMPAPYRLADGSLSWSERYKAYPTLNAQITRNFRHWAVYVGGENLTGYRQHRPVVGADYPWGPDFDATMVYGPLHGAMVYVGFRYNFTKYI